MFLSWWNGRVVKVDLWTIKIVQKKHMRKNSIPDPIGVQNHIKFWGLSKKVTSLRGRVAARPKLFDRLYISIIKK